MTTNSTGSSSDSASPYFGIVFVVLTSVIVFVGLLYYFIRERCFVRHGQPLLFRLSGNRVRQGQIGGGLDPAAVKELPELTYSDAKAKWVNVGPDCVVCLSPFEDHETLRLLPDCGHVFHPDCVGRWLADHTTCPCCRADLIHKHSTLADVVLDVGTPA